MVFTDLKNNGSNKFILLLFFLFPILTATVRDAGSTIYALLGLLSFFHCRKGLRFLSPQEKRFLVGFSVFFVVSCLSLFMTEDLLRGIQRFERYGRFLLLIPIYLMLRKEPLETGKAFLAGAFTAVPVMLGQAWYQVEVLRNPLANGAYHKIIMGDMAIFFTTLILISLCFYRKNKIHSILSVTGILAGLYASLLTGTRTAWLFVPIIIASLAWLYRKRLNKRRWKVIILGSVITCLFAVVLQPERLMAGLEQGFTDLKTFSQVSNDTSLGTRLVMWRNSVLIFKESPLFGTGVGDFKHDSKILLEKGLSYKNDFAVSTSNAHSIYFMLLAEGGLVGLSMLILVLFVFPFKFLYQLWEKKSDKLLHFYALLGLITVFAFAWFGVSESWINRNPLVNAYCMAMLVFMTSAANRADEIGEL